jgi:hypothetical protein
MAVKATLDPQREYSVPAVDVQQLALRSLASIGLPIASAADGRIVTGYRGYAGRRTGVWWMKRQWEERVRMHIQILRSFDGKKTQIFVMTEIEERLNPAHAWVSGSEEAMATWEMRFLTQLDSVIKGRNWMDTDTTRNILSLVVVIGVLLVAAVIVLVPVFGDLPLAPYMELLKAWGALFSGVIGMVLGFHFGRSERDKHV